MRTSPISGLALRDGPGSNEMVFMKCDQLLAMLNDYVDGDISPGLCAELEKHMAGCNPCQVVVDNIRQTITLYKAGQPCELPSEFRSRLYAAVRERWRARDGLTGGPELPGSRAPRA